MDDLLGLLFALIAALKKRASPRAPVGSDKRRTFPERAQQRTPAIAVNPPSASPAVVARAAGEVVETRPAPVSPLVRVPEAGLVRALFGTPQSLVAAFIVAEVLAKPVALREP